MAGTAQHLPVQNTDEADLPETGFSDELIYELEELQERINAGEAIDRISGLVSDNGIIRRQQD